MRKGTGKAMKELLEGAGRQAALKAIAAILPLIFAPSQAGAENVVSFSNEVQPIFESNCVVCHFAQAPHGGLLLQREYAYVSLVGVMSSQFSYYRVVPGKPDESLLVHKIERHTPDIGYKMPPSRSLSAKDMTTIRLWISQGAQEN